MPTSEHDTSRTYHLHDKLYASNRNLQEALIEMDTLSRINQQLNESNTRLQADLEKVRIKNEELEE